MPGVICEEEAVARFHFDQDFIGVIDLVQGDAVALKRFIGFVAIHTGFSEHRRIVVIRFVRYEFPADMAARHHR